MIRELDTTCKPLNDIPVPLVTFLQTTWLLISLELAPWTSWSAKDLTVTEMQEAFDHVGVVQDTACTSHS